MKIASPLINTENKPVKKTWLKPQILLLATGYVEGGANPGHFEGNPSHRVFPGFYTLRTPGGASTNKNNSKHAYES